MWTAYGFQCRRQRYLAYCFRFSASKNINQSIITIKEEILWLLFRTSLCSNLKKTDKAYEEYAKAKGLSYLGLVVLEEIFELGDGCTQKRISDDTYYPKQSVNLVVKAFLEDGLIELKELPENRKNKGITLTDKGRRLCDDVVIPILRQEEAATQKMSESEKCELVRLLKLYGNAYCDCIAQIGKQ